MFPLQMLRYDQKEQTHDRVEANLFGRHRVLDKTAEDERPYHDLSHGRVLDPCPMYRRRVAGIQLLDLVRQD